MKYSYATVALPTLSPEQAIAELRAAGYGGVEWKVGEAPHAMSSTASRFLTANRCTLSPGLAGCDRIRALCADAGLSIVGIGPYLRIGDVAGLKTMLEMAAALGAPQVRLQAPRTDEGKIRYREQVRVTADYLTTAENLARAAGVRVVLEMHHNTIAPSAALAHAIVSRCDPEVIGVIYDIGNLVFEGYEQPAMALQILGPYLHHVHLKNAAAKRGPNGRWRYVWSPLDDGLAPIAETLGLLSESGYDGWVSVEDLSAERDPVATLRHNATVLAALPQAEWPVTPAPR